MIVPQDRTLFRNKTFTGLLAFGILLSLGGVILRGVQNQKIANDTCASGICYGERLCYQYGNVYCCSSQGSDCYGCQIMGEDCSPYVTAEWVLFGISVAVLIALIVVARRHRFNVSRMHVSSMVQAQNVVYSDPRPMNINASVSDEYQRV